MASKWYYNRTGQTEGPVDSKTLRHLAAIGQIKPEHHVWKEGMKEWKPAGNIKGLEFRTVEPPPIRTPLPAATPTTNKSLIAKCVSGVGCILTSISCLFIITMIVVCCGISNIIPVGPELSPLLGEWKQESHADAYNGPLEKGDGSTITIKKGTFGATVVGTRDNENYILEFYTDGYYSQPNMNAALAYLYCKANNVEPDLSEPIYNEKIWGKWRLEGGKLYLVSALDWYEKSDVRSRGHFNTIYIKTK